MAGESWAAAEMPHEVSPLMQPNMIFMSSARASSTILWASRIPVHFISLMLMAEKTPWSFLTSTKRWHDSSATVGRGLRSVIQAMSSRL